MSLCFSPSIEPYACGTDTCWPKDATISQSCFATSKELVDHNKNEHSDEPYTEKPFRCALAGCGKSWKVCYFDHSDRPTKIYLSFS